MSIYEIARENLSDTDLRVHLSNGNHFEIRTDIPVSDHIGDELDNIIKHSLETHNDFVDRMGSEITDDNSYFVDPDDEIVIGFPEKRYSLIYPRGGFRQYNQLFYLDWLPSGALLEVLPNGDISKVAKLTYLKK